MQPIPPPSIPPDGVTIKNIGGSLVAVNGGTVTIGPGRLLGNAAGTTAVASGITLGNYATINAGGTLNITPPVVGADSSLVLNSGSIGLPSIGANNLLFNPGTGSAQPVSVPLGTGLAYSGGSIVATGTSVPQGNLTGPSSGVWHMTAGAASQIIAVSNNGGTILAEFGGANNNITPLSPIAYNFSPPAISGATFGFGTQSFLYQNPTWTGTATGSQGIAQAYLGGLFEVGVSGTAVALTNSVLTLSATLGNGGTGNIYALDVTANTATGTTQTAGINEIHSARFTTNFLVPCGGTSGTPSGDSIGIKVAAASSAASYPGLVLGIENNIYNASSAVPSVYGTWINDNSPVAGVKEHSALSIFTTSGCVGWAQGINFGSYSQGPANGTQPFTAIFGTGGETLGVNIGFTWSQGIDWHLGTISSGGYWAQFGTLCTVDNAGNIMGNSIRCGGTAAPTWTTGAGAPSSTQPAGSLYSNTSGSTGSRLYVSAGGGTWAAVSGV